MRTERGYAMAALLVGMAVMSIMLSVALPVWSTAVQREREAELIFRGEQYARAIELFQRRSGGFPQSLDVLEKTRVIRRLYKDPITGGDFRPVYVGQIIGGQPVVPGQQGAGGRGGGPAAGPRPGARGGANQARGGFQMPLAGGANQGRGGIGLAVPGAGGPIIGVVSTSEANSLRLYNGRGKYNEWAFVATAMTQQAGAPDGAQGPQPGSGAQPVRGGRGVQPQPGPGRQFFRGRQGPPLPANRGGGPALPFPGRGVTPNP